MNSSLVLVDTEFYYNIKWYKQGNYLTELSKYVYKNSLRPIKCSLRMLNEQHFLENVLIIHC